jgi:hypothetical protein
MIIYHQQHQISCRKNTILPYIWISGLWSDYDHWVKSQNRGFRIFSSSPSKFWSIEHNHALYWTFGTLAGLGSRPQAQMDMGPIHKTFLVLRPFEGALACSILITGTQVMLKKAYFYRRWSYLRRESWTPATDPKSWTILLRRTHQRTYVKNQISRTDRRHRHNDFRRAHFYFHHIWNI